MESVQRKGYSQLSQADKEVINKAIEKCKTKQKTNTK